MSHPSKRDKEGDGTAMIEAPKPDASAAPAASPAADETPKLSELLRDPDDPFGIPGEVIGLQKYADVKAEADRRTKDTGTLHEVRYSDIKMRDGRVRRRYFIVSGVGYGPNAEIHTDEDA